MLYVTDIGARKDKLRNGKREAMARTALDGEAIVDRPFYYVDVETLETLRRYGRIGPAGFPGVRKALHTFRGTLIDGNLQPNVRIGNGLALQYILRSPKVASEEQLRMPIQEIGQSSEQPNDRMRPSKVAAKLGLKEYLLKKKEIP